MARSGIQNIGGVRRMLQTSIPKAVKDRLERHSKAVATTALEGVIEGTPEDTSHLIANWQVGINSTPSGEIEGTDPGGSTALSAGTAAIQGSKFGDEINIQNNVDYLKYIISGSSDQEGDDFVSRAVQKAQRSKPRA